jgi:hypothetical protein
VITDVDERLDGAQNLALDVGLNLITSGGSTGERGRALALLGKKHFSSGVDVRG